MQFRDLRAKAGTDKAESSGDILQARDQLGHTTVAMTEQYIRERKGKNIPYPLNCGKTPELRIKETESAILRNPHEYWCPKPDSNRHAIAGEGF